MGFDKQIGSLYLPLQYHTEKFHHPKNPSTSPKHHFPFPNPWQPLICFPPHSSTSSKCHIQDIIQDTALSNWILYLKICLSDSSMLLCGITDCSFHHTNVQCLIHSFINWGTSWWIPVLVNMNIDDINIYMQVLGWKYVFTYF